MFLLRVRFIMFVLIPMLRFQVLQKSLQDDLIDGFEYNATSNRCQPIAINNPLKMANKDYTF